MKFMSSSLSDEDEEDDESSLSDEDERNDEDLAIL